MYQTILYAWPADTDTSATVVWPRSHTHIHDHLMAVTCDTQHFCRLPKLMHVDFVAHARRIAVPAGGMVIWNSRTIHQGWPVGPRLAFPICFEPRSRRTQKVLRTKINCVKTGFPTTHWASLGIPHVVGKCENNESGLQTVAHRHCFESSELDPEILALL